MTTPTNSTESTTGSMPTPNQVPATTTTEAGYAIKAPAAAPVEADSNLDDFGYEKSPEEKAKIPAPAATPVPENKEVAKEDPLLGYSKEAVPVEVPVVVPPVVLDPSKPEDKAKIEFNDIIKDLPAEFDKEKISKFATDNKFTPDQLKAYTALAKEETAAAKVQQAETVKVQRAAWLKDLQEDKEFGGENFDQNVHKVGAVLKNYLPNMKKELTERGSMLPPYIMRDLLSLSKVLNPTSEFVSGDAPAADEGKTNFLDDMYK